MTDASPSTPTDIELDRRRALTLTWPDGLRVAFALDDLRANCPCAECRGRRQQGLPVGSHATGGEPVEAVGAELVGGWGLMIRWSDGHETGIFAWDRLRGWAESGDADEDADGEADGGERGQAAGPT